MRKTLFVGLAAALLAVPASGQNVRPTQRMDTNNSGTAFRPGMDSKGELSVVSWNDDFSNHAWITTSNGRGLNWSAPVQADQDPAGAGIAKFTSVDGYSSWVTGNNVVMAWTDIRFDDTFTLGLEIDLFVNISNSGATAFPGLEMMVPKGYPAGVGAIRGWQMVVTEEAGVTYIYVLLTTDPTTTALEELYLSVWDSASGTWNTQYLPSFAPQTADVDLIGMAANGRELVVCWNDDRFDADVIEPTDQQNDLFFRHSLDAGATWTADTTPELQVDTSGPEIGDVTQAIDVAFSGNTILFGWQEERSDPLGPVPGAFDDNYVRTYDTTTMTFGPEKVPGTYTLGVDDTDGTDVAIVGSTLLAVWRDNRSVTGEDVFIGRSLDGGLTWADIQVSPGTTSGSFAQFPRTDADGATSGDVYAISYHESNINPNPSARSSYTRDGGVTWSQAVPVSTTGGDHGFTRLMVNELYNNVIVAWSTDDLGLFNVYSSGYRPQTVIPVGTFQFGNLISFEIAEWPTSEVGANFKVVASKHFGIPGNNAQLGDGRFLDVKMDSFFNKSSQISALSGTVLAGGVGQTGSFNFPNPNKVPPGTLLHLVAWSFFGGQSGSITDVTLKLTM